MHCQMAGLVQMSCLRSFGLGIIWTGSIAAVTIITSREEHCANSSPAPRRRKRRLLWWTFWVEGWKSASVLSSTPCLCLRPPHHTLRHYPTQGRAAGGRHCSEAYSSIPPFWGLAKSKCNTEFIFQPLTQSRPLLWAEWIMNSFILLVTPRTRFLLWVTLKKFICFLAVGDSLCIKILYLTPEQDVPSHSLDRGGELCVFLKIKKKGRGGFEKSWDRCLNMKQSCFTNHFVSQF